MAKYLIVIINGIVFAKRLKVLSKKSSQLAHSQDTNLCLLNFTSWCCDLLQIPLFPYRLIVPICCGQKPDRLNLSVGVLALLFSVESGEVLCGRRFMSQNSSECPLHFARTSV